MKPNSADKSTPPPPVDVSEPEDDLDMPPMEGIIGAVANVPDSLRTAFTARPLQAPQPTTPPSVVPSLPRYVSRPARPPLPPLPPATQPSGATAQVASPSTVIPPTNDVSVNFFIGNAKTSLGKTIAQVLSYGTRELENDHRFIQYIFPSDEASDHHGGAPIVNQTTIAYFQQYPQLRQTQLRALDMMLTHWNLVRNGDEISSNIPVSPQTHRWLSNGDHNKLRMTRVIISLNLLGHKKLAKNLQDFVLAAAMQCKINRIPNAVDDLTVSFWEKAVRPLKK